jgi:hypothetical protein
MAGMKGLNMPYDIAAIPTKYTGVNFRSRLKARWAAFFDLRELRWDYEPIDLQGWIPDFSIETPFCKVFAEVKPVDIAIVKNDPAFDKARAHSSKVLVLLLGLAPATCLTPDAWWLGTLCDPPGWRQGQPRSWMDVDLFLSKPSSWRHSEALWREAGNIVQWKPRGAGG